MKYQYTKISDLITELEKIKESHGDVAVATCGDEGWAATVYPDLQPYYYDGGFYVQETGPGPNGQKNFVSSRKIDLKDPENKPLTFVVKLKGVYFEDDTNFNGRPIREINPGDFTWLDDMEQEIRMKFGGELPKYRWLKYFNQEMQCYPAEAFLESGLSALGKNIKEAQEALAEKYKLKNPNDVLKDNL